MHISNYSMSNTCQSKNHTAIFSFLDYSKFSDVGFVRRWDSTRISSFGQCPLCIVFHYEASCVRI